MNLSEETKALIMIILSIPLMIILFNQIYKLYQEEKVIEESKKLSFKTLDRKLNRNRRCKK